MTRVLIADDDDDVRAGLRLMLEHEGFSVAEAADGREAIELYHASVAEGHPFAVVVLDHLMPHYKGDVAAVEIRRFAAGAGVRPPAMFMLTGSNDSALMSRVKAAGLSAIYIKPDYQELIDRLVGRPVVALGVAG